MSLLFGNLTQDFVNFSHADSNYTSALQSGDPTSIAQSKQIPDIDAAGFRQSAAQNASYLTYIGELLVIL
jgi:ATP-binding cassette subfamily B (MDR/TAP) protein 1